MIILRRACLCLLLLVLSAASTILAEPSVIVNTTAEGVGVIEAGNNALARDQAIRDALRIAVEQAVGTMVASETLVQNYEVLRDQIYAKTQGYIKTYTIIDEKEEGTLFRVTVQAQVTQGNLQDDLMALGLLLARKNMPRIMLMVAEQNVGMLPKTLCLSS
ncbi:MAG: flagellar assembly protein T N-terminal domain-containing protein [Deltaproteobacteria bacterium]|nr:flagellar assembly protein T N-terminal domain-containing protein [Deltaproteobacteria bacterium]